MSLLTTFIENKIKDYQEPTRKGTPKGEPIGFSKKKFAAALNLISNVYLYTFGDDLEVDYQVLRKWNTEEKFKQLTEQMSLECADYIAAWIKDKVDKCKTPKEWQELIFEPLNDMDRYGETLLSHLRRRLSIKKLQRRGSSYQKYGLEAYRDSLNPHYIFHFDIKNFFNEILDWVFSHHGNKLRNFSTIMENIKLLLNARELAEKIIARNWGDEMQNQMIKFVIDEFHHHETLIRSLMSVPVGPTRKRKIKIDLDSSL